MQQNIEKDVCIIGAGPVGLFAVFECGMLGMKSVIVDALDFTGGQCTALYPEKPIYDVAGFPSIDAGKLIENLEEQAKPFEPNYLLGRQVTKVNKSDDNDSQYFNIETSKGDKIKAKIIIIAAGCGAFGPNKPPLANLEKYEDTGSVDYLVKTKNKFQGKKVVIAGGGDSAVDWANILADGIAEKTYLIHRRNKFRAAKDSVDKMHKLAESGSLEFVIPYQLDSLDGDNGQLSCVNVKDFDGNIKSLEADNLLCFFGLAMELGPIAEWGLNINKTHIDVEQHSCETNISGIYAIGDIATYKGKLKLITCGFSEAAMAAHHAYEKVFDKPLHFEYSTSKGVPGS
jgi:thioredoxin reductase (NADPH)